jgi:hypothetical protein
MGSQGIIDVEKKEYFTLRHARCPFWNDCICGLLFHFVATVSECACRSHFYGSVTVRNYSTPVGLRYPSIWLCSSSKRYYWALGETSSVEDTRDSLMVGGLLEVKLKAGGFRRSKGTWSPQKSSILVLLRVLSTRQLTPCFVVLPKPQLGQNNSSHHYSIILTRHAISGSGQYRTLQHEVELPWFSRLCAIRQCTSINRCYGSGKQLNNRSYTLNSNLCGRWPLDLSTSPTLMRFL